MSQLSEWLDTQSKEARTHMLAHQVDYFLTGNSPTRAVAWLCDEGYLRCKIEQCGINDFIAEFKAVFIVVPRAAQRKLHNRLQTILSNYSPSALSPEDQIKLRLLNDEINNEL